MAAADGSLRLELKETPGLVRLPSGLFVIAKRLNKASRDPITSVGQLKEGTKDINLSINSQMNTSYDSFTGKTEYKKVMMFIAEYAQNIMDWATKEVAQTYPKALRGLEAFTSVKEGVFAKTHKTIGKRHISLSIQDVAGLFRPLVEIVVDKHSIHFLQIGKGMIDMHRLLPIGRSDKPADETTPVATIIPQAGGHGVGAKQLLVLGELYNWKMSARGTVGSEIPDASEDPRAVAYFSPENSESTILVTGGLLDIPHNQVVPEDVLKVFRKEVRDVVKAATYPVLLHSIEFPDLSDAELYYALRHAHILFRSETALVDHLMLDSSALQRHLKPDKYDNETDDQLALFTFPLIPLPSGSKLFTKHVMGKYVNGIPTEFKDTYVDVDTLIITADIRKYSNMERGDAKKPFFSKREVTLNSLCIKATQDYAHSHLPPSKPTEPIKWFLDVLQKAWNGYDKSIPSPPESILPYAPATGFTKLFTSITDKDVRKTALDWFFAKMIAGKYDTDDVKRYESTLTTLKFPVPQNQIGLKQELGPFEEWLFEEQYYSDDQCTESLNKPVLSMNTYIVENILERSPPVQLNTYAIPKTESNVNCTLRFLLRVENFLNTEGPKLTSNPFPRICFWCWTLESNVTIQHLEMYGEQLLYDPAQQSSKKAYKFHKPGQFVVSQKTIEKELKSSSSSVSSDYPSYDFILIERLLNQVFSKLNINAVNILAPFLISKATIRPAVEIKCSEDLIAFMRITNDGSYRNKLRVKDL